MEIDLVALARGWIGTPYLHQASLKGVGCDCLGLVRGVLREALGRELETPPPYAPDWGERDGAESLRAAARRHLTECAVHDLSPGRIALFRMAPAAAARHCGILAARGGRPTLIHARQNRRVGEEPFAAFWRARLAHLFILEM